MNYDSRSTWDSGLDAGSIPARSTCKCKSETTSVKSWNTGFAEVLFL